MAALIEKLLNQELLSKLVLTLESGTYLAVFEVLYAILVVCTDGEDF